MTRRKALARLRLRPTHPCGVVSNDCTKLDSIAQTLAMQVTYCAQLPHLARTARHAIAVRPVLPSKPTKFTQPEYSGKPISSIGILSTHSALVAQRVAMSKQKLAIAVLAAVSCVALGIGVSRAQTTQPARTRSVPLVEDLEQIGNNLFGGLLPGRKPQETAPRTGSTRVVTSDSDQDEESQPWGGSRYRPVAPQASTIQRSRTLGGAESSVRVGTPAGTGAVRQPAAPSTAGSGETDEPTDTRAVRVAKPGQAPPAASQIGPEPAVGESGSLLPPLHQRLATFRQSPFAPGGQKPERNQGRSGSSVAAAEDGVVSDPPQIARPRPAPGTGIVENPTPAGTPQNVARRPVVATDLDPPLTPESRPERPQTLRESAAGTSAEAVQLPTPAAPAAAGQRLLQPGTTVISPAMPSALSGRSTLGGTIGARPTSGTVSGAGLPSGTVTSGLAPGAAAPNALTPRSAPPAPHTAAGARGGLILNRKSPVIGVETVGPRRILVGKESTYEITVHNAGEVTAEELVIFVSLPGWADVLGAEVSTGSTQVVPAGEAGRTFLWKLGQLPGGTRERLALRIVPRESRPLDLAVRWEYKPTLSQATIEVQEPKLSLRMEGPREVMYGKKELFTLRLSNTGNGDAENVVITLMPLTPGDQPVSQNIGTIPAGEEKAIEVELTARHAGQLQITAVAKADGNFEAQLAEKILVRRAALQVEVDGPQVQYVGAVATYRIRVRNAGTAPARNVRLTATIPPGGKYVSGIEAARLEANGTKLQWTLDSLNPTVEQTYLLRCTLSLPGDSRLEVACTADDELAAAAVTTTRVEAVADLVLEVKDPAGPVPLGEEALYILHVRNRGTKSAEGVQAMAFFSRGVEPVAAEGAEHHMAPGQVVFHALGPIAPGGEVTLRVRARAESPGHHVFRAEVHCKPLGTRLASERTTLFYQDRTSAQQANRPSPLGPAPLGPAGVDPGQPVVPDRQGSLPLPPTAGGTRSFPASPGDQMQPPHLQR